ncbi:MAG: hypothetical protein ACPGRC_00930 [Salibacteraceae bacterium]
MINNLFKYITFTLLFGVLFLNACKKCNDPQNEDCENYDPCYNVVKPSAKFFMNEGFYKSGKDYVFSDSVMLGYTIWFESELEDPNIEHRWYLGTETFTGRVTPGRRFDDPSIARPQAIEVTHVIEYEANTCCYPNDLGYDSAVQTFTLVSSYNDLQTYGKFKGIIEGQQDSFIVDILSVDVNGIPALFHEHYENLFVNFHNLGDSTFSLRTGPQPWSNWVSMFGFNHKAVFTCGRTCGTFEVYEDKTFRMEYTFSTELDSSQATYVFRGIKLD